MEETKLKPIYQYILETYNENHRLPEDFSLREYLPELVKDKYQPGRYEVEVSSFGAVKRDEAFFELFKKTCNELLTDKTASINAGLLQDFFIESKGTSFAIDNIPACLSYLEQNQGKIYIAGVIQMGVWLLQNAINIEAVKFGIALIGISSIDRLQTIANTLMVIALVEDFTYYCARIVRCLSDGNDRLLAILSRVKGWGRIDILRIIKIGDTETALWIIGNCSNGPLALSLYAPTIAIRINVAEVLNAYEEMPENFFKAVCNIIEGITDVEVQALEHIPDYEILLGAFLDKLEKFKENTEYLKYVKYIKNYLSNKKELNISEQIIIERCESLE